MAGTKAKKANSATKNRNSCSKRPSRRRVDDSLHEDTGDDGGHRNVGGAVGQDEGATQEVNVANVGARDADLEKEFAAMKGKPDWNC